MAFHTTTGSTLGVRVENVYLYEGNVSFSPKTTILQPKMKEMWDQFILSMVMLENNSNTAYDLLLKHLPIFLPLPFIARS